MLDRADGDIVFICDGCEDWLYTETNDFCDAQDVLREMNWRTSKVDDKWEHRCPSCKPKSLFG